MRKVLEKGIYLYFILIVSFSFLFRFIWVHTHHIFIWMGPKKRKAQDEDESTEKLARIYRRKCEEKGITPSKLFREKIELALDGDPPHMKKVSVFITQLMFWEEVGAIGTQAIF